MDAGNGSTEVVHAVEQGRVGVGEPRVDLDQPSQRLVVTRASQPGVVEELDGVTRPHRPLAQQPTHHLLVQRSAVRVNGGKVGEQVHDDVVVVSGVQRDLSGAAGGRDPVYDVQGGVAVRFKNLPGAN